MWNWLKKISWDWLPLSGIVVMTYMIQRGFMAISKGGYADADIKGAMAIFFTATAFAALGIGFLSDRVKAHWLIAFAGIAGTLGILSLGYSPVLFGIGMGIAAATAKIIPFASPIKRIKTKFDALRITPQSCAKTAGKASFMFLLGAVMKTAGFTTFTSIIAPIFAALSACAFVSLKDQDVPLLKWNLESVLTLLKNKMWYVFAAIYAASAVAYYNIVPQILPAIRDLGYSKADAAYIFGTAMILIFPFRWFWAAIGDFSNKHQWVYIGYSAMYPVLAFLIIPAYPIPGIIAFMILSKASTSNYWITARRWLGEKYLGTGMGMTLIATYITIGLYLGKW